MAILTAAQIRSRMSRGSPALSDSEFPDAWVEEARDVFMDALVNRKGVAYEPTTVTEKIRPRSNTDRLVLAWPKVTSITSITVNGTALDSDGYELDEAEGMVMSFSYTFTPRYRATVVYVHGYTTTPTAVKQACALFVERSATQSRSTTSRDVSREGFDGGSSTVYIRANAEGDNLTAFSDVNDLVAALPTFKVSGIG